MKIAIASGKGGTGKTTLSTNLASYLAEKEKVVLTDLDVEEPNSGLFILRSHPVTAIVEEDKFKMVPEWIEDKCTLCGICQKVCNFHAVIQLGKMIMVFPELCHGCYACSELCPESTLPMIPKKMGKLRHFEQDNLNFVESRLDIGEEQAVPLISQTQDYIDEHFANDVIRIYDSPPGTSCPVIEVTKDADFVILVTEPTPFGLHDLKLAVDTMIALKKNFGVVVNRYGIGNDDVINYCEEENIPLLAKIPNDRRIAELYSNGKLIYREVSEVLQELDKIIAYIGNLRNGGAS
ncbi:MAG: ATP-binding protein [Bacteroidales bacterium]|nr:ATP-binding protein [Bacteroidales bacterium]